METPVVDNRQVDIHRSIEMNPFLLAETINNNYPIVKRTIGVWEIVKDHYLNSQETLEELISIFLVVASWERVNYSLEIKAEADYGHFHLNIGETTITRGQGWSYVDEEIYPYPVFEKLLEDLPRILEKDNGISVVLGETESYIESIRPSSLNLYLLGQMFDTLPRSKQYSKVKHYWEIILAIALQAKESEVLLEIGEVEIKELESLLLIKRRRGNDIRITIPYHMTRSTFEDLVKWFIRQLEVV